MLKRMSIKKIMVSTCAIIVLLIIYILPDNSTKVQGYRWGEGIFLCHQ